MEVSVAVWVAQFIAPTARGLGLDRRLCLGSTQWNECCEVATPQLPDLRFNKLLDVLHTRGFLSEIS